MEKLHVHDTGVCSTAENDLTVGSTEDLENFFKN